MLYETVHLVGVVLVLGALSAAGAFGLANDLLYDVVARRAAEKAAEPARVLLVEVGEPRSAVQLDMLVRSAAILGELGAARIIVTQNAVKPGDQIAASAEFGDDVIVARPFGAAPPGGRTAAAMAAPAAALVLPRADYGIHRRQQTAVVLEGSMVPTAEWVAAAGQPSAAMPAEPESFLVRFDGGLAGLPLVTLEQVTANALTPELVQGRTVLIGPRVWPGVQGLFTPIAPHVPVVSPLQYHGFVLNTLLAGHPVRDTGLVLTVVLLVVTGLAGIVIYRLTATAWYLPIILLAGLAALIFAYGVLQWVDLLLPVTQLLVAQLLLALLTWQRREVVQDRELGRLLRTVPVRIHDRSPAAGDDAAGPLASALAGAAHHLGLTRALLLGLGPKAGAPLREIAAFRASLDDIPPPVRDPRRPPFATALTERRPVTLAGLLRNGPEGEELTLLPLARGGESLGFLVVGADHHAVHAKPGFAAALELTAGQLTERLLISQNEREGDGAGWGSMGPLLAHGKTVDRRTREAFRLFERRIDLLAGVLEQLSTAAAVFDLLGSPVHANRRMGLVLQELGLPQQGPAVVDLVAHAAVLTEAEARGLVIQAVAERRSLSLPTRQGSSGARFLLRLAALEDLASDGAEEWPVLGLVCELVEVTHLARLADLRRTLASHLGAQLRNDLEAVLLGVGLLASPQLPEAKRASILDRLRKAVGRAEGRLRSAEGMLERDIGERTLEPFALDPREPARRAVEAVKNEAKIRRVRLSCEFPELVALVIAAPHELEEFATAFLRLLVADAREDGTVSLRLTEELERVVLRFSGEGYGLPDDRLEAYLSGVRKPEDPEMRLAQQAARRVQDWGGRLTGSSRPGGGIVLELTLRKLT